MGEIQRYRDEPAFRVSFILKFRGFLAILEQYVLYYILNIGRIDSGSGNIFDYLSDCNNAVYFDSGRSALKHLVSRIGKESKVLLPEFI